MTKEQKDQLNNLYSSDNSDVTSKYIDDEMNYKINNSLDYDIEEEKKKKQKAKEREKRIKKQKKERQKSFDLDIEKVIGMTKRYKENEIKQEKNKITKKQKQILRKKEKIKRIIKLIFLILLIIGGIIFMLVSPLFNVKEISVLNNEQIPSETIISLSQIQKDENIFKYNSKKVKKNIKGNPYIENVEIKRKVPNKVEIIVEERQKNYNIEALNGFAYINNQGYILENSEQKLDTLLIQGLSTEVEQIVAGNRLNLQDLSKLEVIIQIMNICKDYEIDKKVSTIDISDKNNYIIYMESEKKTIYLGDDSNLSNKMLYIPAILLENEGKEGIIYLDGDLNDNFKPRFKLNVDA